MFYLFLILLAINAQRVPSCIGQFDPIAFNQVLVDGYIGTSYSVVVLKNDNQVSVFKHEEKSNGFT
jgi:hypothetical protein